MSLKSVRRLVGRVCDQLPVIKHVRRTRDADVRITFRGLFVQRVLGINKRAYWPVHFTSKVTAVQNIRVGIATAPGMCPGCYIQAGNGIEVGDYTFVAPGVGLISGNHSVYDLMEYVPAEPLRVGRYCWIGMNAVILPGVCLGDHTVVGAGSVVTKSFPEGYCVVAGVPARVLRHLDRDKVIERRNEHEYVGFHPVAGKTKEDIYRRLGIRDLRQSPPEVV